MVLFQEMILSLVGGRGTLTVVRRILEKVFDNSLATQYNWTGKNKKIALRGLKLPKVITGNYFLVYSFNNIVIVLQYYLLLQVYILTYSESDNLTELNSSCIELC